jgi:uncharacterized protein (TIGR02246 family)
MSDTVEEFLNRIRQAWDAGDAKAFGEEFAEDASYIIFMGDTMSGRPEITETHHGVFTKWQKGTRMAVRPLSIRQVSDDIVVVVSVGGIGTGEHVGYDKLQTYVLRDRGGRYECVAFQNTEMSKRALARYSS